MVTQIPAIYGRNRVGCEITDLLEADRHWIGELARVTREQGSEDDRRPEVVERLEAARDSTTAENQPQRPAWAAIDTLDDLTSAALASVRPSP